MSCVNKSISLSVAIASTCYEEHDAEGHFISELLSSLPLTIKTLYPYELLCVCPMKCHAASLQSKTTFSYAEIG